MAFSRAKIHRFNEVSGCAPPPGTYQPKWKEKPILGVFEKSKRFNEPKVVDENARESSPRSMKTPIVPKKQLTEKQFSTTKRSGLNRNVFSCKEETPKQNELPEREVMWLNKKCGCNCSVKDAGTKYAAQIKQILEKHKREVVRLELLKEKMDQSAVVVADLMSDILHYKGRISVLNHSNAEMIERTSSLQQLNIEYRLQIAELQDTIDCMTAERNEINMEHKRTKRKLKEMEVQLEKFNLKAAEAKACMASEHEAKREMEVIYNQMLKELVTIKEKEKNLLDKLDNTNNDLALEKARMLDMQNRYENAATENRKATALKEQDLIDLYNKKIIEGESVLKEKLEELSQTKTELENMKARYALQVARRNEKEEEMSKVEFSLRGALLKVEELAQVREKMESEITARLMSIMRSGQLEIPEETDRKYSLDGIFAHFQEIMKSQEELILSNRILRSELAKKEEHIHSLDQLVGPFREQLEMYENERHALQNITLQTKGQLEQLALQHAAALGHQNHKQKIRHLVQLKEHNLKLQEEIQDLNNKLRHKERIIAKLNKQEKGDDKTHYAPKILHVSEKENSFNK